MTGYGSVGIHQYANQREIGTQTRSGARKGIGLQGGLRKVMVVLGLLVLSLSLYAQTGNLPAERANTGITNPAELKLPVAHAHFGSWCMGFLTIAPGEIRYDAVRSHGSDDHSFSLKREEVLFLNYWALAGQPMNAVEIRTADEKLSLLVDAVCQSTGRDAFQLEPRHSGTFRQSAPVTLFLEGYRQRAELCSRQRCAGSGETAARTGRRFRQWVVQRCLREDEPAYICRYLFQQLGSQSDKQHQPYVPLVNRSVLQDAGAVREIPHRFGSFVLGESLQGRVSGTHEAARADRSRSNPRSPGAKKTS